jgi:hypothetical protein
LDSYYLLQWGREGVAYVPHIALESIVTRKAASQGGAWRGKAEESARAEAALHLSRQQIEIRRHCKKQARVFGAWRGGA